MYYYYVWVRAEQYRAHEPLTYASEERQAIGAIVEVPLKKERVLGFITSEVSKPAFNTKLITASAVSSLLPPMSLLLAEWLMGYYPAPIGVITAQFLPPQLANKEIPAVADTPVDRSALQVLTEEQQAATARMSEPDTYVIHGRTGSGKTRIYVELALRQITIGRSCLILTPEIGLTPQLVARFKAVFGERVITLHSQLTARERRTLWLQILDATTPLIVIGPRSALFAPLEDVGLIIVDESHDSAYKQESAPYYHAVRVAAQLRNLHNAILVLGSATPSVADYYLAQQRHKPIIRLTSLAVTSTATRSVAIIDLKDTAQFSRSSHISNTLIESVRGSLERGEQALLYLNRRGTARITLCDVCGWQALCPRCDLPLTYHGDTHRLRCHTCGFEQAPIMSCPVCNNTSLILRSFGTKAITAEISKLFPEARVQRFDTDNRKDERLESNYTAVSEGAIDILVGTQLLAKGLDLPKLSTLGVIVADSSLFLPDYTARERTYQLITQVLGRIGRGHLDSQAVLQTYAPDSPILQAALNDGWDSFYNEEIAERQQYIFPPFCYMLKVTCRRASAASAERALEAFCVHVRTRGDALGIDGPVPSFHEKVGGKHQWQIIIKAKRRGLLLAIIDELPKDWSYDIDPVNLL